jgi:hypothetical protein
VQLEVARNVYDSIQDSVGTTDLHVINPTKTYSFSELSKRTGLSAQQIEKYSPHLNAQYGENADIILPDTASVNGEDTTPWHKHHTFSGRLANYDFSSERDRLGAEIQRLEQRADSLDHDMWEAALHVVHNNHTALQSAYDVVVDRIQDARHHLNRGSRRSSGTRYHYKPRYKPTVSW